MKEKNDLSLLLYSYSKIDGILTDLEKEVQKNRKMGKIKEMIKVKRMKGRGRKEEECHYE